MSDDLEETVKRVIEASEYSAAEITAFADALARAGESAKEVFERMAESLAAFAKVADEPTKHESSRQRFREKGKRRW